MKKKINILKLLKCIFLFLGILTMLVSLFGKVHATDYSDNPFEGQNMTKYDPTFVLQGDFWSVYQDTVGITTTSEFVGNINTILEICPKYYIVKVNTSENWYVIWFFPEDVIGLYLNWTYSKNAVVLSTKSTYTAREANCYCVKLCEKSNLLYLNIYRGFYLNNRNGGLVQNFSIGNTYTYNIINSSDSASESVYYYKTGSASTGAAWYGASFAPPDQNMSNSLYPISISDFKNNNGKRFFNFTHYSTTNGAFSPTNGEIYTSNINGISYSEDNRFKMSIINNAYGEKELLISLKGFFDTFDYNDLYVLDVNLFPKEITLGIDKDGTESIFIVDASTGQWDNKYTVRILLDDLDMDDYGVVKVVSSDFTLSALLENNATVTEDYHIALDFYLKGGSTNPEIEQDTIEKIDTDEGLHPTYIETGNVFDSNAFRVHSRTVSSVDDFVACDWADVLFMYESGAPSGNVTNALDDLYENITYIASGDWQALYNLAFTTFDEVQALVESNNRYTEYYDIVVFDYDHPDVYVVFYTHRYFTRLMFKGNANLQTLLTTSNYYVKNIYSYMYDRLENFTSNATQYYNADLELTRLINENLISINSYVSSILSAIPVVNDYTGYIDGIEGLLGDISSKSTGIINAINSLEIGSGDTTVSIDWTDLTVALGGDLNYLFVPTYNDIDDKFEDYMDDIGILALPFNAVSSVYDTIRNGWSETMDIKVPKIKILGHELYSGTDFSFTPWSLFVYVGEDVMIDSEETVSPEIFQYLIAYFAILASAWFTYCHIFRRSGEINED